MEHRKRELGRAMTNLYTFLNLVGFVALLLGGIGVASTIQVHVKQKLPTVAILRSLGCTSSEAFAVYLVQGIVLALAGATLGAGLGLAVQLSLPAVLADFIPIKLSTALSFSGTRTRGGRRIYYCVLFAFCRCSVSGGFRLWKFSGWRRSGEPRATGRAGRGLLWPDWRGLRFQCLAEPAMGDRARVRGRSGRCF